MQREVYDTGFDEEVPQATNGTCPECDGHVTTTARETVCDECGLVIDESRIDHGAEWHSFDADVDDADPTRVGAPLTPARHDRGLSTVIGFLRDGHGNRLDLEKRRQLGRLRREQRRAVTGSKRGHNLREGCCEIRRITGTLGLDDSLRDQACQLFRTAQSEDLLRGRSIESMAAASVYATCRCRGLPRTLAEFDEPSRVSRERIANAYGILNRELELPAPVPKPRPMTERLASDVDAPDEVRAQAVDLAERATDAGIANGRRPSGVAAACVYAAAEASCWPITQGQVATAADTTSMTLQSRLQELREHELMEASGQ